MQSAIMQSKGAECDASTLFICSVTFGLKLYGVFIEVYGLLYYCIVVADVNHGGDFTLKQDVSIAQTGPLK